MSGWRNSRSAPLLGAWVALLALGACGKGDPIDPPGRFLRLSQRNEPATLDPHLATLPDEFFIIRALGEGLLVPAPAGGAPRPAAAEHWEVTPDGLTYVFHLRPGARWSDGRPVTAGDFVYSIHRALSPALAAPKAALFFPLKNARNFASGRERDFAAVGVRALDDQRLEISLEQPLADFPAIVASGPWIPVPRTAVEKAGGMVRRDTDWSSPGHHVGNGPFTLMAWRPNQDLVVQRNETYWDRAGIRLQEIRFLAFDNGGSEERAFRAGQVDVTMDVPFSKLAAYRQAQPPVLNGIALHETRYLALNTTRPPLDDRRVRRALSLALSRPMLTGKVLLGGQQPAFTFLPPGLGGYDPGKPLGEDAAEARRLLAEAGFPDGRGFPRLELTTWGSTSVLEAIQQMWRRELGIEVTIAQREARTHLAALVAGDYAIAMMTAIPDYDGASALFNELLGDSRANYPRWRNAEYDRLVADGGRLASPERRNAAYQQAERLLLEEQPLIPLYFNTQNFLVRPGIRNWHADRMWTRFYRGVSLE